MPQPKRLTVTEAGKLLRGKDRAAWKSASPEERERATEKLNGERAAAWLFRNLKSGAQKKPR